MKRWALVAALVLAAPALAWLDGWMPPSAASLEPAAPPEELRGTLDAAARDLASRTRALAENPEVARSLEGGGIAVQRERLFASARQAAADAPAGTWIALTDPQGNAQVWWGDAPGQIPRVRAPGTLEVRWSTTRMELLHWGVAGKPPFAGLVCAGRSLPVEAPDFARALGLERAGADWEPIAPDGKAPVLLETSPGRGALLAGRTADVATAADTARRGLCLALLLAIGLALVVAGRESLAIGAGLALAFLGAEAFSGEGGRALASPRPWLLAAGLFVLPAGLSRLRGREGGRAGLRLAAGYALAACALVAAAQSSVVPDLGAAFALASGPFLGLVALAALTGSALAIGASAGARVPGAAWTGVAITATTATILAALLFVSPSRAYPLAVTGAALLAYEAWRRAIASAPESGTLGPFRLLAGATLLLLLLAAPFHEHSRAVSAYRVANAIRLPDPERISAGAVVAVRRAVERVEQFDLSRELPAPAGEVDLSDLAYRLWRDGEARAPSDALIAYEVFDRSGLLRSRFSLIPEADAPGTEGDSGVRIERHRVAVVRQSAVLSDGGAAWGRAMVSVADWPSWDPLPPRLEVYRRLVGAQPLRLPALRPVLVFFGPDGARREEGPDLPAEVFDRVRRSGRAERVRLRFRSEALWGELRPLSDGFQLVAIPGPEFLPRLLTAALLLPAAGALYVLGGLIVLARTIVARRSLRDLLPPGARTFRGRLIALFVLSVMIPLFAVTFFLRASIATRSRQDTLDHARSALETARRVLDDYLPSASAARGRLGLIDDALLAWLANAVGFDLSVYSPEALLAASSRRDLYAAGLLPERVPGASYVAIGLGEAREASDARLIAGSRFEELTTGLSAVPGVPGVRSPVLLSLLLLPQQRVAEAEAAQLTAAVSAFALLVFLVSAAIAGRLAVRVARPVADLVQGTRAVARGDFAPRLAEPPDEELRELVRAFLFMSRSLKEQTDALSREKERLATLLAQLTAGVVAYGPDRRVLLANPAAARLAGGPVDGGTLDEVFPGEAMRPVREALERFGGDPVSVELEPRPGERWSVVTVPLPLAGTGARMAVIEDVSDVVRSNRLAAWAEMARIIAHEIKNPLTPIRLSVEHLREVWRRKAPDFERVLEDCVSNVLRQTEELRRSASEFGDYSRLPRAEIQPTDVGGLVREAAAAYAAAPGIRWVVDAPAGLLAMGDPRLLSRVFSNLVGNSVDALENGGEIRLAAQLRDGRIEASVEDDGPGVAPEILPRLFDPYFSAKSGGSGLGLAIAKKIVEEHGGSIGASNRSGGGFRVRFDLPAAPGATS